VVSQWASADPKAAAAWASGFPEGSTRENAINSVMSAWAHSDPAGAGEWLAALPAGKGQERAIQNYVNQLAFQFPDWAAAWTEKISDPQQRTFAIENVARQWLDLDRKSAEAWLKAQTCPRTENNACFRLAEPRAASCIAGAVCPIPRTRQTCLRPQSLLLGLPRRGGRGRPVRPPGPTCRIGHHRLANAQVDLAQVISYLASQS